MSGLNECPCGYRLEAALNAASFVWTLIPSQSTLNKDVHYLPASSQPDNCEDAVSAGRCQIVLQELRQIWEIAGPMVLVGLLLYTKSMVSMLFLGRLGELELAGGSLAIGFANITGYSVLSGLSTAMEPICAQAYGAKRWKLIGLSLQRTFLILLCFCLPIGFMWVKVEAILLGFRQDAAIARAAHTYLLYSLPDLAAQAALNPLRIYLRTQKITQPLTWCAACALVVHVVANLALLRGLHMGIRGVALASAITNCFLVILLVAYVCFSGHMQIEKSWDSGWSWDCFREWLPLLRIALPSCASVCLEWWWYELMVMLSGLLPNARSTVGAMGVLIQTTSLLYIFPSALSVAVSTRVGNELGANWPSRARVATLVALGCAVVVATVTASFTVTLRHVWGSLFTTDPGVLQLTAVALPVLGLCELGNCPQTTGCGVLRGSARPSIGANINLTAFYVVGLPVAVALGFYLKLGFIGLWFGLLSAQFTCALLMVTVILSTDWNLQAVRAKQLTDSTANAPQPLLSHVCKLEEALLTSVWVVS